MKMSLAIGMLVQMLRLEQELGKAHADGSPLSAEVAEVEVDMVKAVEESVGPKRQQRRISQKISSLLLTCSASH